MQSIRSTAVRSGARKRRVLAIAGTSFLLAGAGSVGLSAFAEPVDSNIASSCSIGGSQMAVTVPLTVDDKVDPITAGGHETLETKTGFPALPVEVTIDKMVVTEPIPDQIASTESVEFSGGNMTGSYEISGQNVVLTFTGPVSSKDVQVPTVTTKQTVKGGIAPTTIDWKTFSQIVADTSYGQATCVPNDPNQNVNTTSVVADGSTTTTSPTPTPTTTPTTPPTTTPGSLPTVPGSPTPTVPTLPSPPAGLPAPPTLPTPPSIPGVPTGPCPTLPVPVPPSPVGCPAIPGLPPLPTPPLPTPPLPSTPTLPGISLTVGVTAQVN